MKITVRKANAVQAAINEAVFALDLSTDVSVNEFQNARDVISAARDKFAKNSTQRVELLSALYIIRRDVARANAAAGISDTLTEVALLEKQIGYTARLAKLKPRVEMDVLNGKLGKIKARASSTSESYRFGIGDVDDEVNTSILEQSEVDGYRTQVANLKKKKALLQDALLELNVKTNIEVDADTLPVLTAAGIL